MTYNVLSGTLSLYTTLLLKSGVGAILYPGVSVSEWVSESVRPENLVSTKRQKQMKGISLNFGHRCIWVLGVLIRF